MATLDPRADKVVRDAVDAFMEGRLVPDFPGETVFETKNSRYRLRDGVVIAAPDPSLLGAELVGWLCESARRCLVESLWQPGSRAVLVDRKQGRNIVVTSTTKLLHFDTPSGGPPAGHAKPAHEFRSWHPPAMANRGNAPFSPARAPIVPATPFPPGVAEGSPESATSPLASQPPFGDGSQPSQPSQPSQLTPARRSAVHPPPRPIASLPAIPRMPTLAVRPLPVPAPPPRRDLPPPPPTQPDRPQPTAEPPQPTGDRQSTNDAWEITSAELEIADDVTTALEELDAPRQPPSVDASSAEPFPLVRPRRPESDPGEPPKSEG
jgi:hypothetical protein